MTAPVMVQTSATTLATRVDGAEGLPWLIMSNSLGADMSMWEAQLPALTAKRRVLRYDTRGHGASADSAPPGPYDFKDLTGDVIALMDHYGIDSADIVGLSMGGMTALGLAIDHGARVHRAVCANARAAFPPPGIAMWDQRSAAVAAGGMAAVADDTVDRWFTPATRNLRPELARHAMRMILATSPEGYMGCTAALKGLAYLSRLSEIAVPMLYIAGAEDTGAPPAAMAEMQAATPGAALVVLPDVAHISNIEAPEAFNAVVTGFLFD
ncbi:3-oxoadipate enol-lactonase [Tabrizicola sp. BL-A-41-H6]|uniref:3-oxoadipate enol-lactonase n=1 Tax=Tabrizicola sp. BL-A-41-H6 TaxID=3421107 RepID=UPI003D66A3C1